MKELAIISLLIFCAIMSVNQVGKMQAVFEKVEEDKFNEAIRQEKDMINGNVRRKLLRDNNKNKSI